MAEATSTFDDSDNQMDNEDESSSDDTEEEKEPKLCYKRLLNDIPDILNKDAASCMAIHTKFLALGTHRGVIHILDHEGNNIRSKELDLHVTTINQISIEEKGNFIASCSNDGKVVVHGLLSTDLNTSVTIDRPVRSIALDPSFSQSSSNKRFIIGEDKVVLYEKTFFSRYKPTILYQGEGPIRNIKWKERFIVWSSDKTVRVFDLSANITISVIQRDSDPKLRPDLYRCNFFWKDNRTLLIGWANSIKVCKIVQTDSQQFKSNLHQVVVKDQLGPPRFYVVITSIFNTDFCICGISDIKSDIVVLTVCKDTEMTSSVGLRPQARVLKPLTDDFQPISKDVLSFLGYQEYRCNDYHIDCLSEDGKYFILSPKDFIAARQRDDDDHVKWLIEHEHYKEAVEAVLKSKDLKKYTLLKVGLLYLDHLLQMHQYNEAASFCPTIFGTNKKLWEEEVYKFAPIFQLRCIAPYLPIEEKLDPSIYELVLNEFLQKDSKGFLDLIRKWPSDLYNIPTIINALQERMLEETSPALDESLCELYELDRNYDAALSLYIQIKNNDRVFDLIGKHEMFSMIHDKLEILMELNSTAATEMFLENVKAIPVDLVVSKLKHKPHLLFKYLSRVILKDITMAEEHHHSLVELFAEYEPKKLEAFLRSSNSYVLEDALKICQQRNLTHEMIFLLGRTGNTKQALHQITHELRDIHWAIEFCKENHDMDLWEDLIKCSLDNPDFITVLLQNIGTHVDPIILIQKIPKNMMITGLRDSLVKILHDYNLQISLREGCEKILVTDCFSLLEKLNKQQRRGILVNEDKVCYACHRKILTNDLRMKSHIYVFNCKHCFHDDCISVDKLGACTICNAQKRPGSLQLVK